MYFLAFVLAVLTVVSWIPGPRRTVLDDITEALGINHKRDCVHSHSDYKEQIICVLNNYHKKYPTCDNITNCHNHEIFD